MQLISRASEAGSDVRCPVCGQGFLLYWTRKSPQDQPVLVSVLMDALGRQHVTSPEADAHPSEPFLEVNTLDLRSRMTPSSAYFSDTQWGYC